MTLGESIRRGRNIGYISKQTNKVMAQAREGDNILIGFDHPDQLHCVLIPSGAKGHRKDALTWEVAPDAEA